MKQRKKVLIKEMLKMLAQNGMIFTLT